MRLRSWCGGLLLGVFVWGLPVRGRSAEPLKIPDIRFDKYKLPNGLTVIAHEDHRLPLVAVDLWYHVGPLNERPGRTGFAHLFEHMMFEGSEHVGEKAHFKFVESAGGTDINGTTDFDRTNYFETLPSNQLELGLWLESDRMGFLMEGLDRTKLTNQRDVVRNERRQGEGRPYAVADETVYHLLFPKTHPYYASVIGSHADIEAARIKDVRDFHQQFYTPNNATISIAGDFDPKHLRTLLEKYFGPIPQGPAVPPVEVTTPPITKQRRATVTDTVQLPQVQIAWLTPPLYTQEDADLNVAMMVLGGRKASRLEKRLIYDQQLAQEVNCDNNALKLTGIGSCTVTAKPGVKLEDLEAAVWDEIGKLQTQPPTRDEIEAARAPTVTYKITSLQRLGGFGGVADTLAQYDQYTGDPGFLKKDLARGDKTTPDTVRAAAARYLSKDASVVVYCVPGKKLLNDVPRSPENTDADVKLDPTYTPTFEQAQNWRKTPPAPGPEPTIHLPVPAMFSLANGLKVYFLEEHELPVFSASLVSRAGGEANMATTPGMAGFAASMMTEGTESRPATQQALDAQKVGASLRSAATMDSASAAISSLSNQVDASMDLLSDAVEHAALREPDVERIRKQKIVGLLQEQDDPVRTAIRVGPRLVFGDQPYGLPQSGTDESLKKFTREDLLQFRKQHYGPNSSALIVAGDVSQARAKELAERYFGSWHGEAVAAPTIPAPPAPPAPHIVIVDKPGSPQTALLAFGIGVPASVPNLVALETMNYTLGGSFGSRINMNLREEHGYTYGAFSEFQNYRAGGMFFAGALVRTDVTAAAEKELMSELHRVQTDPPSAAELKAAKDANIQSLPGHFVTAQDAVSAMSSIFLYTRPLDYFAKLPERYLAVGASDVTSAAREDVHPDQLVVLAVGDKAKIEPGLKEAKLPIQYWDASGKPMQ